VSAVKFTAKFLRAGKVALLSVNGTIRKQTGRGGVVLASGVFRAPLGVTVRLGGGCELEFADGRRVPIVITGGTYGPRERGIVEFRVVGRFK
jgi:hypothetical protein